MLIKSKFYSPKNTSCNQYIQVTQLVTAYKRAATPIMPMTTPLRPPIATGAPAPVNVAGLGAVAEAPAPVPDGAAVTDEAAEAADEARDEAPAATDEAAPAADEARLEAEAATEEATLAADAAREEALARIDDTAALAEDARGAAEEATPAAEETREAIAEGRPGVGALGSRLSRSTYYVRCTELLTLFDRQQGWQGWEGR
ncbi:hypothetical protein GQ44DRAFT_705884 [Phaeosphaeriaceae sp. PMI808]|nr:hypothetical protein GQ44DRAFT_705884 [Phaeosphaeriaceae sp. PMI808]